MAESELEKGVAKFGEEYRVMITDALRWLDENEPLWGLKKRIGRKGFIASLVRKGTPRTIRKEA